MMSGKRMTGNMRLKGVLRGQSCMLLLLVVASILCGTAVADTPAPSRCPLECKCDADSSIRCTGVSGLRSIDKSQPIARLDLSALELTKIPTALENMRNITELDLSENRLSEVNHLGKRVRKLNLSHNRITSGKLARIPPFLESLNLTHNEITHLPLHLMKLKKLRYIELANNPINCTCETLHIRNWLTSRHVWSDEHIKCMAPAEFKGRPWLQVRQSDVCHPTVVEERKGGYNWDDYEDDNELMMGDQAHHVKDVTANEDEDQDDFRKEYFPVGEKVKRQEPPIVVENNEEDEASGSGPVLGESSIGEEERRKVFDGPQEEGSGDDVSSRLIAEVEHDRQEKDGEDGELDDDSIDEGSGSGGGVVMGVGHISFDETGHSNASAIDVDDGMEEKEEEEEESPLGYPTVNGNLGIFLDEKDEPISPAPASSEENTSEGKNARVMIGGAGGIMKTAADISPDGSADPSSETPLIEGEADGTVASQSEEDNQNTYILLAILGIIVVSLIVTVICKRKPDSRNRRGKYDVETANQARELKEINKNLLEKLPGDRNGHGVAGAPEQTPLMGQGDYDKVFGDPKKTAFSPVKPQRASLEKPLESFKPIAAERHGRSSEPDNNNTTALPNGNGALHNGDAPAGVHKSPSGDREPVVPDVTDSDGHLLAEPPMESPRSKRYSPIYVPTSPKSDRYSPVYSPETGRVKIKLTETPKPKTPILVTRSRSRAGEIITTMDDQKF